MSANKMFQTKAKLFTKKNNVKPKQKSSIQSGDRQKLNRYFIEGQNTDGVWEDAAGEVSWQRGMAGQLFDFANHWY